ncbi:MAG: beta-ketoacyl synthase N-terminal-like domain-containing protein [Planctomycetaceae bacterium]
MPNSTDPSRGVVITGLGVLTPQAIGSEALAQSLRTGRTGLRQVDPPHAFAAPGNLIGAVWEFTEETAKKEYLKAHRKHIKVMSRDVQLGVASAMMALEDAAIASDTLDRERIGVEFGSNLMFSTPDYLAGPAGKCVDEEHPEFSIKRWAPRGMPEMEPLWMLKYLPNMPACHVGIFTDSRGPNNSITCDEVSGGLAMGEAASIIRRDSADVMIVGSIGNRVHQIKAIHAGLWDTLGSDPEHPDQAVKPYDVRRNGHALSEAGIAMVLEGDAFARGRGARVLGTVLGTGSSCVAGRDGRPDYRKAVANAMTKAMRQAGLTPADIGHINGHGFATPLHDAQEALAIHDVFGQHAGKVPVTGLKGYHGSPGAAGGLIETAMSLLALRQGEIPQTLNTTQPDASLGLNVVIGEPIPTDNPVFIKVTFTLIGQAVATVIRGEPA